MDAEEEVEFPPWDLEEFGFPTAVLGPAALNGLTRERLAELLRVTRAREARLCAAYVPHDAYVSALLESAGFRLVETSLTLERAPAGDMPDAVTRLGPEHLDAVAELARRSFRHGRYHADPRFPDEMADARYGGWVRRTAGSQDAEHLGVVDGGDGGVVGFVQLRVRDGDSVQIQLGPAVDERARGRGLGRLLLQAALARGAGAGAQRVVSTVAARNLPALRQYSDLEFRPVGATDVWHLYPIAQ
jgi:ribosomal protein S18 acetylase RimI-like enzyme